MDFRSYMHIAMKEARAAGARGEVPVGAVVVGPDGVVAQAGNRTREMHDPTAHAEVLAIRAACTALGQERLAGHDLYVTLAAAAGETNIKQELREGKKLGDMEYKVHLDGYNLLPALKGEAEWPRKEFLYWTDDGSVAALRYNNWKITFLRQDAEGIAVWENPYTALRAPMIANLRMDPFERAFDESIGYGRWWVDHMFVFGPAAAYVGQWLQSFKEFPPRQKPGSFNLDNVMKAVTDAAGSGLR